MKRACACAALALAMAAPVFAAETKGNAKTQWGVGARLGSVTGVTMQYKMDNFDIIAAGNFGFLHQWVAAEGGVNFQVMKWDNWTPGEWAWTIGAVIDIGYSFDDDGSFFIGAFAPFRLNYTFPEAPWSFYVELGPGIDMYPLAFDMEGGIGATYLFN